MKEITIHDGRPIAEELDMEVQGFEFLKYDTAVTDFTDDEQVKNIYYPELEKLLLERTGAKEVLIFDHTIRVGDPKKREKLGVRDPYAAPITILPIIPPHSALRTCCRRQKPKTNSAAGSRRSTYGGRSPVR